MTAYNWRIIQKKQIIEDELNKSSWLQMNQGGYRHETIRDQDLCKSDLELYFLKSFNADNFHFYADWRISNNIGHFVTFEKSKTTCPFNGNEALRLSYLIELLIFFVSVLLSASVERVGVSRMRDFKIIKFSRYTWC